MHRSKSMPDHSTLLSSHPFVFSALACVACLAAPGCIDGDLTAQGPGLKTGSRSSAISNGVKPASRPTAYLGGEAYHSPAIKDGLLPSKGGLLALGNSADLDVGIGLFAPYTGTYYLKRTPVGGQPDLTFDITSAWGIPVAGDWDGDGLDGIGFYNTSTGEFRLKNDLRQGAVDHILPFGPTSSTWKPVAGDWDGDDRAGVGLYDGLSGTFYLKNDLSPGHADHIFRFGPVGNDWEPVAGDWTGSGHSRIGLYDRLTGTFHLRNHLSDGVADATVRYGPQGPNWKPLAGNWDGAAGDGIGLFDPAKGIFYLKDALTPGKPDYTFSFKPQPSVFLPLAGRWGILNSKENEATVFGFNYWPYNSSCAVLINDWTLARKQQIAAEIDHMASMGVGVVRLMFWPEYSGFVISESAGNRITAELQVLAQNLPELLAMFAQRNIEVIISFGNYHLIHYEELMATKTWQDHYGVSDAAFTAFLEDSKTWIDAIVQAAEESPSAPAVLYYDFQNELHFGKSDNWDVPRYASWYLTFMHDWSRVPAGKRGVSVLIATPTYTLDTIKNPNQIPFRGDANYLVTALEGRPLDYLEFHFYAHQAERSNPYQGVAEIYQHAKTWLPQTTVLVGECGAQAPEAAVEPHQSEVLRDTVAQAVAAGVPYVLSWQFLDRLLGRDDMDFGVGYEADSPKDAMEEVASLVGLLADGGMEHSTSGWEVGGSVTQAIKHWRICDPYAAAGECHDRLQVDQPAEGLIWLLSEPVDVTGKSQLFVNAYLRASRVTNLFLAVLVHDGTGSNPELLFGSMVSPQDWQWHNYLHHVASKAWPLGNQTMSFPLPAGTVSAQVGIAGTVAGAPAILDIDTVSAAAR